MQQLARRALSASLVLMTCLPTLAGAQLLPLGLPERIVTPGDGSSSVVLAADPEVGASVLAVDLRPGSEALIRSAQIDFDSTELAEEPLLGPNVIGTPRLVTRGTLGKLVVWSQATEPQRAGIFARRLANDGSPFGPVLELVAPSPLVPGFPAAACDAGGRCAISWYGAAGIEVVFLNAAGALEGPARPLVAFDHIFEQALGYDLEMAADGRFAITWIEGRRTTPFSPFFEQRPRGRFFTAAGEPAAEAFDLDEVPDGTNFLAVGVAGAWSDDGTFLAVWDRGRTGDRTIPLLARSFAGNGAPLSPPRQLAAAADEAVVAWCGPERGFTVAWDAVGGEFFGFDHALLGQVVNGAGEPLGVPVEIARNDGQAGQLFSLGLDCDGEGNAWLAWIRSTQGRPGAELETTVLRSGPPVCRVPFVENPPWAVSCAGFGPEGRFVSFASFRGSQGESSEAGSLTVTRDAISFFFNNPANPEVYVKTVDGRALNDTFWLFYGALSNQEYQLSVFDRATGRSRTYSNPQSVLASVGDTSAFPDEPAPLGAAAFLGEVEVGEPLPPFLAAGGCAALPNTLCLADLFSVELDWADFQGNAFAAQAIQQTPLSGYFAFFDPNNVELAVKILDGRAVNGKFWVFYAALTNVEFTLTIRDGAGAVVKRYQNARGSFGSVADTAAF